jgi:hypothetical protein
MAFSDLKVDDVPVEGYEKPVRKESEEEEKEEGSEAVEETEIDELPEAVRLTSAITVSLNAPEGTDPDNYDFEFSIYNEDLGGYLGFQGKELFVSGQGNIKGSDQ